jgi:hypothetical protein
VIDDAKTALRRWAADFDERHNGVRDPERLRRIHKDEQRAPGANMGRLRRAMAALDFALFVTALVNYSSNEVSPAKVRQIQQISGEPMSRRNLWDRVPRIEYFIAGCMFEVQRVAR